ncbi:facilitated trehalose transporter Tret1-like [Nilaparvata lugens]|uniref:facilitated trehalose transporter Tret1-like n=1 Tax=Nilaparvata lugens TaxID=108931 RepID=UPI00193EA372|nr:facilitated trehalose transporter Tret1-like [Nilaparvata lugens]
MTYGSALGWPSPVLVQISQTGLPFTLDASQISWMVSLVYVTNLLSPLPAGALMDALGRKRALILLTLPALISWPIALLATDVRWLYLARLLVGIQGGASTTIAPTYISETACAKHRGAMNTMGMFFCFVGIFYSYIIGHLVSYASLCLLNGLIPLTFILLFSLLLPDTPYWYLMKNNPQLAAESLAWLNSTTTPHIQNELNLIQNGVQQQISNKNSFEELLRSATNRRALIILSQI